MTVNVLKVLLWSREVGRLYWDSRKGIGYFEYNPDFLRGNLDPFPLAAPIAQTRAHSVIAGERSDKFYSHLPSFIADSLPDSWGDQVFEFWRSHNGIRSSEISPLDKLSFIGKRAMGALEFIPETSNIKHSEAVNLQELIELSQRLFSERIPCSLTAGSRGDYCSKKEKCTRPYTFSFMNLGLAAKECSSPCSRMK